MVGTTAIKACAVPSLMFLYCAFSQHYAMRHDIQLDVTALQSCMQTQPSLHALWPIEQWQLNAVKIQK
jgi:hypothetical protein